MRVVQLLSVFACLSWLVACEPTSTGQASSLAVVGVTIIDGTGATPRPNQTLVIEGSTIAAVGEAGEIEVPEGARVIDGAQRWIVPGFIDLHVHLPPDPSLHAPVLGRLLEFGVTTILNPGARPGAGTELRERIERGEVVGPRMLTAGGLIDVTPEDRGYGAWAVQTPTDTEIRDEIRRQTAAGADFIKLYAGLSPELVTSGIDEGRTLGIPVIGHLESTTWLAAARSGIAMLVHSGWSTPMEELIDLSNPDDATDAEWYQSYADAPNRAAFAELATTLVEQGVVVVPTLSITQAGALGSDNALLPLFETHLAPERDLPDWWGDGWELRHPQYGDTSAEEGQLLKDIYFPGVLGIHRALFERGVTLGVGTDVGNAWMTPGASFHHELELYSEAGIPALEILAMATRNGAEALGLGDSTGTIEVGKRADFQILDADPVADIHNTRRIISVFLGGREIPRP